MSYAPASYLQAVVDLCEAAGRRIMQIYADDFEVERKADNSPLTDADLASHRLLVRGLRELTPELPILSEESASIDWEERRQWSRYWLVDPLDGTKEFINRNGEFTVNVALIDQHQAILGVVSAPVPQVTWYAATGVGAFRRQQQRAGESITTRSCPQPPTIVASRSHRSERLQQYLSAIGPHEDISCGSSLKFCRIAEGAADCYPRLGPTSEWDTAAGQCVVEQAGGKVIIADGSPLQYNAKESILNPEFLVIGDDQRQWPGLD
ncbi:MAG: 3'(2'),5'-bisphosphate nucleotidase CysQ [Wenzhouxiangellaceae bacterium]